MAVLTLQRNEDYPQRAVDLAGHGRQGAATTPRRASNLGVALAEQGRLPEAIELLPEGLADQPDIADSQTTIWATPWPQRAN